MKTTIEIGGYEIKIEEMEGNVSVSAMKEGEVVEEFELPAEDFEDQDMPEGDDDDMMSFGDEDMEEEGDFEEEGEEGDFEEEEEEEEEEEGEGKLESFSRFVRGRRN